MKRSTQNTLMTAAIAVAVILIVIAAMAVIKVTPFALYINKGQGIQMKYPAYWTMVKEPEGGALVVFVAPLQSKMDVYHENVNVTSVSVIPRLQNLETASKEIARQLTGTFENAVKVLEMTPVKLAGRKGYRFVYVGSAEENSGKPQNPIKNLHVWTLKGNRLYIITYSARSSDFDAYYGEVKKMINSFKFI